MHYQPPKPAQHLLSTCSAPDLCITLQEGRSLSGLLLFEAKQCSLIEQRDAVCTMTEAFIAQQERIEQLQTQYLCLRLQSASPIVVQSTC